MRVDWLALGIICGLILFSLIMYCVFRRQSKKSENPDAQLSNASIPTLLHHAPPDSQNAYSASMLSLIPGKSGTPNPNAAEQKSIEEEGKKFKRRLFFEDTEDDAHVVSRGGQAV